MSRAHWLWALCVLGLVLVSTTAEAAVLRVPARYPTIQAAVDAAKDGDRIVVSRGKHCGATLTKRVRLEGRGKPRIIGCDTSPLLNGLRVGFLLSGTQGVNPASGSRIKGFVFDGEGVSNANLTPLSFGVFARFASNIRVTHNRFVGTVQAITNTGGDRWVIRHNRIEKLTLLDCTVHCTGGDGIVIALARGAIAVPGGNASPLNRPEHNIVSRNRIEGVAPDRFGAFSMAGVLLLSADNTTVLGNDLRLRDNPKADAVGQGILVSNTCCGLGTSFLPGSRNTIVALNDGRRSEVALVVEGTGGANTQGLITFKNRGKVVIDGAEQSAAVRALRAAGSPPRAQPTL